MKKETFIAIFLGIFFGVLVAMIMIVKNRDTQIQKTKTISNSLEITPTIIVKKDTTVALVMSSPEDKSIVTSKTVTLKGKVTKNALLVIQSPVKQSVTKATSDTFSVDFPLVLGENIIRLSVYPEDSASSVQEKQLTVFYLGE
jgi:hypothetical protein